MPLLAAAAPDDDAWRTAVERLRIPAEQDRALRNLRSLLAAHPGGGLGEVAEILLWSSAGSVGRSDAVEER